MLSPAPVVGLSHSHDSDSCVPINDKCAVDWKEWHIQTDEGQVRGSSVASAPMGTKGRINRISLKRGATTPCLNKLQNLLIYLCTTN